MPSNTRDPIGLIALRAMGNYARSALAGVADQAKKMLIDVALPISIPGINDLIDLYIKGMLDDESLRHFARAHGIPILGGFQGKFPGGNEYLWTALIETARQMPPSDPIFRRWLERRQQEPALWTEYLTRSGADHHWWTLALPYLFDTPGVDDWLDLYTRGLADESTVRRKLNAKGALWEDWQTSLAAAFTWPDPTLLADAKLRDHISEEEWDELTLRLGVPAQFWRGKDGLLFPFKREPGDVAAWSPLQTMRDRLKWIPSPGDLIAFAVKDVFDPAVAGGWRLFDDYPKLIDPWLKKLGMIYPIGIQAPVDGVMTDLHFGHLHWGQHWRNLGAGQFFEFLHRIREDNVVEHRRRGFDVKPFTIPMMQLGLKTDDYPPQWRDYLGAVSYRPMEARRVQQGLFHGIFDRAYAVGVWQDRGYHKDDAERMVSVAIAQNDYIDDAPRRTLVRRQLAMAQAEYVSSYETGTIGRPAAKDFLSDLLGSEDAAENLLHLTDARMLRDLADKAIKAIRSDWLAGTLTLDELRASLLDSGIDAARVEHYVRLWTVERGHKRRAASSGQILSWVAKGLMTPAAAVQRLTNLNWYGPDVAVLLADSLHKLSQLQAKEQQQIATTKRKQAEALAKLQREVQTLQKNLQAKLRASQPVSRLIKWLKDGILDVPQFRSRMQAIGILPRIVNQYIAEALQQMEQAQAKADAAAKKQSLKTVRHAPISTLRKWFKLQIIGEDQFRSMAADVRVSPDDIDRYVQEVSMGK